MRARSRPTALALSPFLAALDERLGALPADELRTAVADFARTLAPNQRQAFLEHFHATTPHPPNETAALAAAIDVLEEEAAGTGEPEWGEQDELRDRYGWFIDEELAEPDWAPELIALLERAGGLFVAGESDSAARAYDRLLRVAAGAVYEGWSIASEPEDADVLREAVARYLRALWEVTNAAERPDRLRAAVTELSVLIAPAELSLTAVAGAGPTAPSDGEQFIADWLAALEPIANDSGARGSWAHRLLVEGVAALEGPVGLARLARAGGSRTGDVYVAWVDTARAWGHLDQAVEAAAEGLRALPASPQRAALADRVATLAENAGDARAAVDARLEAWASGASLDRMLAVVHAARQAGSEAEAVASLAERAEEAGVAPATRVALLLLAGRLESAMAAGAEASPALRGDWMPGADAVLVPALLIAGVDATRHEAFLKLVLADLLRLSDDVVGRDDLRRRTYDPAGPPLPAHNLTLGELLTVALAKLDLHAEGRRALLEKAAQLATDAVATIVEAKSRRRYRDAAAFAIAHAEAIAVLHGQAAGDRAAAEADARYPRHSAYRSELAEARRRSPILSTPTGRR